MKHILVFGAGKSATCLIDYLKKEIVMQHWTLTVVDANAELARSKVAGVVQARALSINVEDEDERNELIGSADIVISLLPPALHYLVAKDCVTLGKNLLTASYVDEKIGALKDAIAEKGLLFICEMGLDPGIDHMSAMQLIAGIRAKGGRITSFKSHCGGLVAPESDDNPWHYKISWNPRNVVMAGKAGAIYKENNHTVEVKYHDLFNPQNSVEIPDLGPLAWYANRDSLSYIPVYGLETASTFLRTTLRYPAFSSGWQRIIELKLTDETVQYNTDGLSLCDFFQQHFAKYNLTETVAAIDASSGFMQQLQYFGLQDKDTLINKGQCSAADVMQFVLEQKLVLKPHDKDMIVMLHELEYELNGSTHHSSSCLLVKGEDQLRTAMAKTVGLPLGIAAKLILQGRIKLTGLHIPILPAIYEPVLAELEEHGVQFTEE